MQFLLSPFYYTFFSDIHLGHLARANIVLKWDDMCSTVKLEDYSDILNFYEQLHAGTVQ